MPFTHNSKVKSGAPSWSSVDKGALPRPAFADQGEAGKKSTWGYPHHWIDGGTQKGTDGVYENGTMYLHEGGLDAAWAEAQGARSGKKASQAVIDHLQAHRKALGLDKPDAKKALPAQGLMTRSAPTAPNSWNEDAKSVRVTAATENPVGVWDWERFDVVPEVLLMSGANLPANGQLPVLDSHARRSVDSILGSARAFNVDGQNLFADVHFSDTPEGQRAAQKVKEGHLTDVSVGYNVNDSVWVPEGETAMVGGREFTGPVKVARSWTPKELSLTPIGADTAAKARAEYTPENNKQFQRKENFRMDKRLLLVLQGRGLAADATQEEALAYFNSLSEEDQAKSRMDAGLVTSSQPGQDPAAVEAARAEAVRVERERITAIREVCRMLELPDLEDGFIGGGVAIDQVRAQAFAKLAEKKKPIGVAIAGEDERDKFRAAATDSILIRAGHSPEKPAAGAGDLTSYTLREMARECLRRANRPASGNIMEMVGRAFVTSDFPNILAGGVNKQLLLGWQTAPFTWQIWCGVDSLPDFKAMNLVVPSEADDLDLVPENGDYKFGDRVERKEVAQLATYGKLFAITRQAIINDDLGAFTKVPMNMGSAAARKVNAIAYAVLNTNANMQDGIALFNASHGNLGTAAAIGLASVGEAIKLMGLQKNMLGKEYLEIRPKYVLAPKAIEAAVEQFFNSGQIGGLTPTDSGRAMLVNPYAGTVFERVYSPYLDATSSSNYFFAGPKGMTVTVYFLNGIQSPYMEERTGWTTDGIEYKVRIDACAKAVDWRGLVKNPN